MSTQAQNKREMLRDTMKREDFVIPPKEMELTLDLHVQKILELMVVNVPPEKRLAVAIAVRELAEPLWKSFAIPPDPYNSDTIFRGVYFRRKDRNGGKSG